MNYPQQFKGAKVLVLGLAKSGFAAAQLVQELGAEVVVNDFGEANALSNELERKGIRVISGGHPTGIIAAEAIEYVIKNPGIPYTNPVVKEAIDLGISIVTEIELAYLISEAPFVSITGSNGKTTTTTLLFEMLQAGAKKPLIAGNIGTVASTVAKDATRDQIIVLETSSFQLMGTETFRPAISIITNLYDAHLDYHGSFDAYREAKANSIRNQQATDYFIYNADQQVVASLVDETVAQAIPFSLQGRQSVGISADEKWIYWEGEKYVERIHIRLPGRHNLENIVCAIAAAIVLNCPKAAIVQILSAFEGVRHRIQYVTTKKGVRYYNDSKATNTLATKSALEAFTEPVILLVGGLERGHSFEELRPYMNHVRGVIALGETKHRVVDFATSCQVEQVQLAETMEEAVEKAAQLARNGEVVLLSPASASWDQYKSFELRGDAFITAVEELF